MPIAEMDSDSPSLVGVQLLQGRYTLSRSLGRGAFGDVFLATDQTTRQLVAIKRIRVGIARVTDAASSPIDEAVETLARPLQSVSATTPSALDSPSRAQSSNLVALRAEAEILSRVEHPRVVRFIRAFEEGGALFLVMEHAEGDSLERAAEEGAFTSDPSAVVRIAVRVCDALEFVHQKGILHLDLKPSNVLLLASGDVKLLDFGVARLVRAAGQAAGSAGTPIYMSPEHIHAGLRAPDARSDLYSLGALLYHLLAGQPPFTGALDVILRGHLHRDAPDLRALNPAVPEALAAIVHRLLAKRPEDRYQAAAGLVRDLELCLDESFATSLTVPVIGLWDRIISETQSTRYGRADELDAVVRAIAERRPGVHLVEGSEGVGKSWWLEQLAGRLASDGYVVVRAQASPSIHQTPVVVQLVREAISSIRAGDRVEAWREHLRAAPPVLRLIVDEVPGLEHLWDRAKSARVPELTGESGRLQNLSAWRAVLRLVSFGPEDIVSCVDDAQWTDAFSRDVVGEVSSAERVCGWCIVYRPGESASGDAWIASLSEGRRASVTRLEPLGRAAVTALVKSVFGESRASAVASDRLWDASRGLPQRIRVGLAAIVARAVVPTGERLTLSLERVSSLELATTDEAAVAEACAAASETEREVLTVAALLGDNEPVDLLESASELPPSRVKEALQELQRAGILAVRASAPAVYGFCLRTTPAALRNAIEPKERADRHRAIARRLEEALQKPIARSTREEIPRAIGFQRKSAGDAHAAAPWLAQAGIIELRRRRFAVAVELFELVLKLAGDVRVDEQSVREWLGDGLSLAGRMGDAIHAFETALGDASNPFEELRLRCKLADALNDRLEFKRATDVALKAAASAGWSPPAPQRSSRGLASAALRYMIGNRIGAGPNVPSPVARLTLQALGAISTATYFTGELKTFLWSHLVNLSLAEQHGDPAELAKVYGRHVMVVTAIPVPLLGRAQGFAERATRLAEESNDIATQASSTVYTGYLEMFRGRYAESAAAFERARTSAAAAGDFLHEYFGALGLVTIDIRMGNIERARRRLQEIVRGVGELGRGDAKARTDYYLAEIAYWQGNDAVAVEVSKTAMRVMREFNDRQLVARAWWIFAAATARRGDRTAALETAEDGLRYIEDNGLHVDFVTQTVTQLGHLTCTLAEEASGRARERGLAAAARARDLALARTRRMPSFRAAALVLRARLAALRGDVGRALRDLDEAQRTAERIGVLPQVTLCHETRGLLLRTTDPTRAESELRHTLALYRSMGFGADVARLESLLRESARPGPGAALSSTPSTTTAPPSSRVSQALSEALAAVASFRRR